MPPIALVIQFFLKADTLGELCRSLLRAPGAAVAPSGRMRSPGAGTPPAAL